MSSFQLEQQSHKLSQFTPGGCSRLISTPNSSSNFRFSKRCQQLLASITGHTPPSCAVASFPVMHQFRSCRICHPTSLPTRNHRIYEAPGATLTVSWIRANYLLGATQVTERIGLTSVVLSIILGLVAPTGKSRWMVQNKNPDFDREWVNYENLLLSDPNPPWNSPLIQEFFGRSLIRAASGDLGWVEVNEISVLKNLSKSVAPSLRVSLLNVIEPETIDSDDVRF